MVKIDVKPGVCGFDCKLTIEKDEMEMCSVKIDTKCAYVKSMEKQLQDIDGTAEVFQRFDTSTVYRLAGEHCKHLACPVPCAVIKGLEAESGLALPKDVEMKISKE